MVIIPSFPSRFTKLKFLYVKIMCSVSEHKNSENFFNDLSCTSLSRLNSDILYQDIIPYDIHGCDVSLL